MNHLYLFLASILRAASTFDSLWFLFQLNIANENLFFCSRVGGDDIQPPSPKKLINKNI